MAGGVDIGDTHPVAQRLGHHTQTVRRGAREFGADGVHVVAAAEAGDVDLVEARETRFETAESLLQALMKRRPMAMASPTLFIEVERSGSERGNFSKAKRGILVTT